MKKSYVVDFLFILVMVALVWIGCSDKVTNPVPPLGTFKCNMDGDDFTASYETAAGLGVVDMMDMTIFGGTGAFDGDSVAVTIYIVEDGSNCPCIISLGGFDSEFLVDDATIEYFQNGITYSTSHTDAHGSMFIKYSSDNISGTFNFVAYEDGGTDSIVVKNGAFNLQLEEMPD